MNKPLANWLKAIRPHTLPLALSAAGMGNITAAFEDKPDLVIIVFSIITAMLLQILSNLSNDYGDFKHGVDNSERKGPQRSIQSGDISVEQMRRAIKLTLLLSLASGIFLLFYSVRHIGWLAFFIMLAIGIGAIWAAHAYTASKNPYGYKGYGDIFVFIFFGLVAVAGTNFLHFGHLKVNVLIPACAVGFCSVGVLNLNNMRDMENDALSGKITFAVKLGWEKALWYHSIIIILAAILFFIYSYMQFSFSWKLIFSLPLLLLFYHIYDIHSIKSHGELYPMLKKLSLYMLFIIAIFGVSLIFK